MNRSREIRDLLTLVPAEVEARAGDHLIVCDDLEALHERFARDVAREISANNGANRPTRLIVPVGPTGQYPILADIINHDDISLENTWFFFMDEYADGRGVALPVEHPLSFKGEAEGLFFDSLDAALRPPADHVVFPNQAVIDKVADLMRKAGGIDTCYGGIGIHGHVAFNEPEPGIAAMGPRLVKLNDFTVTINAVRSHVGGNLENYPRQAFTLGMREILGARRICLYCRNGCEFDWANTVLRLALFGEPGDDYPVTHIRDRDYVITTDRETLESPRVIL